MRTCTTISAAGSRHGRRRGGHRGGIPPRALQDLEDPASTPRAALQLHGTVPVLLVLIAMGKSETYKEIGNVLPCCTHVRYTYEYE